MIAGASEVAPRARRSSAPRLFRRSRDSGCRPASWTGTPRAPGGSRSSSTSRTARATTSSSTPCPATPAPAALHRTRARPGLADASPPARPAPNPPTASGSHETASQSTISASPDSRATAQGSQRWCSRTDRATPAAACSSRPDSASGATYRLPPGVSSPMTDRWRPGRTRPLACPDSTWRATRRGGSSSRSSQRRRVRRRRLL